MLWLSGLVGSVESAELFILDPRLRPNSPRRSSGARLILHKEVFTRHGPALSEPVPGSCYPQRDQNPAQWFCAQDPQLLLPKICRPTHAEVKELMPISRNTTVAAIAALSIAAAVAGFQLETTRALAVPAPQGPMGNSSFLGAWCAQGDPTKHCSVSGNGVFLTFTNENGETSTGRFVGMQQNVVSADQWNFVQGTLSADGRTINWSNGTYWTRCSGGGGHRTPNLDGTWYGSGDRSQSCNIRQRKRNLQLRNESGQSASGNTIYWD